jgi:hypothetical protein
MTVSKNSIFLKFSEAVETLRQRGIPDARNRLGQFVAQGKIRVWTPPGMKARYYRTTDIQKIKS